MCVEKISPMNIQVNKKVLAELINANKLITGSLAVFMNFPPIISQLFFLILSGENILRSIDSLHTPGS
jgi:hypothetical protein